MMRSLLFVLSLCFLHALSARETQIQTRQQPGGEQVVSAIPEIKDRVSLRHLESEFSRKSRQLLQDEGDADGGSEFQCNLQDIQISQYLDTETRVWRIGEAALSDLGNDLQSVVNCSEEGDVILLDVSQSIQITNRVIIPWTLTFSADTNSTDPVNGVFPRTERKIIFNCQQGNEGIFFVRSAGVTLANLAFEQCNFDNLGDLRGIVEVQECTAQRIRGTVQLHHVRFSNNQLSGAVGLLMPSPSCSSLEMTDVQIRDNQCIGRCGAVLSTDNTLQRIEIEGNTQTVDDVEETPAILYAPAESETAAQRMTARNNEGAIIFVESGYLTISDSIFSENSADLVRDTDDVFGASINLFNSSSLIEDCTFQQNAGEAGSAIFTRSSEITLASCTFEENTAIQGGAIFASESRLNAMNVSLVRNFADENGGALLLESSSTLDFVNSTFLQNVAEFGGAFDLMEDTSATLTDSIFTDNTAIRLGGTAEITGSSLTLENCRMSNGNATSGGFLASTRSTLVLRDTTIESGTAAEGGAILAGTRSDIQIERSSLQFNEATGNGGAIHLFDRTAATIEASNFSSNSVISNGAAVSVASASLVVLDSLFSENSANVSGGAIECSNSSECTVTNTRLQRNRASNGGAVSLSIESEGTLTGCVFLRNTATESGAAVFTNASALTIEDSLIFNNTQTEYGAVFASGSGSLTVSNSTFRQNSGTFGSGLVLRQNMTGVVTDSLFDDNSATRSGGAAYFESVLSFSQCQFRRNSARTGGSIYGTVGVQLDIADSIFVNGTAETRGGCVALEENSSVEIQNVTMENNQVGGSGGAVALVEGSSGVITDSLFRSNAAENSGGAVHCRGPIALEISDTSFTDNSATDGGVTALSRNTTGTFRNSIFRNNRASGRGGVSFVEGSSLTVRRGEFSGNAAGSGGVFLIDRSNLAVDTSDVINGSATESGGCINAVNSAVIVRDSSVAGTSARDGGAVWLDGSGFEASGVRMSACQASVDGGAIYNYALSSVLCSECILENNVAGNRGGAIFFESNETQLLALQLSGSSVRNNSATSGGGLHFETSDSNVNCAINGAQCTLAVLSGTVFRHNRASQAGGAIFASDFSAVRLDCSEQSGTQETFYERRQWESMNTIRSNNDVCPSWRDNTANGFGATVSSTGMRVNMIIQSGATETVVNTNNYRIENHESGRPLPTITLMLADELGQETNIRTTNDVIQATMTSPDNFFRGSMTIPLENGRGSFTGITAFQSPGVYTLLVRFDDETLETYAVEVEIRECAINEVPTTSGPSFCQPCNSDAYNFLTTENSTCSECPGDGICDNAFIRPDKEFWHQAPCSNELQRCLTERSCDFDNRDQTLAQMTMGWMNCTFDEQFISEYTSAQCRKGHTGPLCGSCEESYGRSQSLTCEECFSDAGNYILIATAVLILLCLTGFTVRGNLVYVVKGSSSALSRRFMLHIPNPSSVTEEAGVEMSEEQSSQPVSPDPENPNPEHHRTAGTPENVDKEEEMPDVNDEELAKWKTVEAFKIAVNFVQVTALAVSINVDWSESLVVLFYAAEFGGGLTSEATNRSVDCLVSDDYTLEKPILSTLIDILVPVAIVLLFSFFWFTVTLAYKMDFRFFLRRAVLSAVAVFYISYISLTKTLLSIVNCIEVHDSTDVLIDSTSHYWAVDTSMKCYEGSHAVLAYVAGWPLLALFSVGFPIFMAYIIIRNVRKDFKEGWIYDVSGFMYRSYSEEFVYWESCIMLRKALLAAIVVFGYPLGGSLQEVLGAFVLALALYLQIARHPYRDELSDLNQMEAVSLLVSQVTFVSSMLFYEDSVPEGVRIAVTVGLFFCNVGLFLTFIAVFFHFRAEV